MVSRQWFAKIWSHMFQTRMKWPKKFKTKPITMIRIRKKSTSTQSVFLIQITMSKIKKGTKRRRKNVYLTTKMARMIRIAKNKDNQKKEKRTKDLRNPTVNLNKELYLTISLLKNQKQKVVTRLSPIQK